MITSVKGKLPVMFEHIGLNQRDEIVCRTVRGALMMRHPV